MTRDEALDRLLEIAIDVLAAEPDEADEVAQR